MPDTHSTTDQPAVALIPAAGIGHRLGRGPKALLTINGKSLLRRAVDAALPCASRALVGVSKEHISQTTADLSTSAEVFEGGDTRYETIKRLFSKSNEHIILVHDAARPFASTSLIQRVVDGARQYGSAVAVSPTLVPVAHVHNDHVVNRTSRSISFLGETPQAFSREIFSKALDHAMQNNLNSYSPWELVLELGFDLCAVPSEETNIKVTTPIDWDIACKVIAPIMDSQQR